MRVEIICAAGISKKEKAMNAIVRALLSTYLDIALSNIARLKRLACELESGLASIEVEAYQAADVNLLGSSWCGVNRVSSLRSGLRRLLDASHRLLRGSTAVLTTTSLAAGADKIVKRLVEIGRHCRDEE